MPSGTDRKNTKAESTEGAPAASESVTATEARDRLGELLNRAGFGEERIIITDRGKVKAAIIGPRDLELLLGAV